MLNIIYDRDKEIENFKASTYYKLLATFKTKNNEEFEGTYYNENNNEKFEDKKVEYDVDVADGNSSDGRVITIEMDPNSNSMILIDSKASNKVPITKQ